MALDRSTFGHRTGRTLTAVSVLLATSMAMAQTAPEVSTEQEETATQDETQAAGAWATLQEATDPDIVAVRRVLEVLIQDRRRTVVTAPPRASTDSASNVRSLESRIRRLESEVQYLRSRVDRLR